MTSMDKIQNRESCCSVPNSALFFLTGLGTGVALTLLLAPLSGDATRSLVRRKMKDGKEWVTAKAAGAGDYVAAQANDLRDRAADVAEAITRT